MYDRKRTIRNLIFSNDDYDDDVDDVDDMNRISHLHL